MGSDDNCDSARTNNVNNEVKKILWKVETSTKFHFYLENIARCYNS